MDDTVGAIICCALSAFYIINARRNQSLRKSSVVVDVSTISSSPAKFAPSIEKLISEKKMHPGEHHSASLSVNLYSLTSLRSEFPSTNIPNPSVERSHFIPDNEIILYQTQWRYDKPELSSEAYLRAGPRASLHFDPPKVTAAIVTSGGLCPGMNNVIRGIVHCLYYQYNVKTVLGVQGGYTGFRPDREPILLTVENTAHIHHQGGSFLPSARGGLDLNAVIDFLKKYDISQLYIIGGDGTHRAADLIAKEVISRRLNIAVCGIPKTIDNDVDLIDRSFGFQTAVEAAQIALKAAKTEAMCNMPNGIGLVKLMGRSAGFVTVYAVMASGEVDLCLIPELPIVLDGPGGCLPFLFERVKKQGNALVVVAEGAGEDLLGKSATTDAGGNRKMPPIGDFLKDKISSYFKAQGSEATIKYIDPSYIIRSGPANPTDAQYCLILAQNAVHGAMAGFTAFSIGLINNRLVYIPISRIVATSPRVLDTNGRSWERVLALTRQPDLKTSYDPKEFSVRSTNVV